MSTPRRPAPQDGTRRTAAGLPAHKLDKRLWAILNFARKVLPPSLQLAQTVALEHYTAMLADLLLADTGTRIEGSVEQAKGKVKEVAGKVTGDSKLENEGKAQQVAGKVQNTVGGAKDGVRDALDK